jgi:hypothetical protein
MRGLRPGEYISSVGEYKAKDKRDACPLSPRTVRTPDGIIAPVFMLPGRTLRASITNGKFFLFLAALLVVTHISAALVVKAQTMELHKNCATLSAPGKYPDYEPLPKYRIERREPDSPPGGGLLLGISVSPEAINGGALTRLACKLGSDFAGQKKVEAYIFDDEKAARNLAIYYTEQRGYGVYLWHFKARYTLDRSKNSELIEYVFPTLEDGLLTVRRERISLSRSPTPKALGRSTTKK